MSDKLHDFQKRASRTARDVSEATDDYVHEHTWASIAFAAVIGCVIGYLLSGRRD